MPFRPLHDRHAIQEVVFVLTLGRSLGTEELEAIVKAHDRWREELPKLTRFGAQEITLTDEGAQVTPAEQPKVIGVAFDALKRDGTLDWRLRLQQNWIGVNCLSYTRWNQVWPTARTLLDQVGELLIKSSLPAVGAALQYIDSFVWEGDPEQYRLDELLRTDSEYIPKSIWSKGPLWHLYQGWFKKDDLVVPGRRLEKIHIDATERDGTFTAKIDTTLRHDLNDQLDTYEAVFVAGDEVACIDAVFTAMHVQSSSLLKAFITDEMAQRISLNG